LRDFADFQDEKVRQLEEELRAMRPQINSRLQRIGTSADGYAFTEVGGVTVVLISRRTPYPWGGFKVPALVRYRERAGRPDTSLDAAVRADEFFRRQSRDSVGKTGHFGPIVNTDWYCNDEYCPCRKEDDIRRRKDRSLSGNRTN
jgi:hypothetical protein